MPAPTPVAESYIVGAGSTFTLAGYSTANMTGGITVDTASDEMTNNGSTVNGVAYYEDVSTMTTITATIQAAYKTSNPPLFVNGKIYACVLANATSGAPSFYGNFRLSSTGIPDYFNVKGGVKINLTLKNQGYVSMSPISNVDPI